MGCQNPFTAPRSDCRFVMQVAEKTRLAVLLSLGDDAREDGAQRLL